MRLNKFLAAAGVASRRKCDNLIKNGEIRMNGKTGDFTGAQVDPEKDVIEYRGRRIQLPDHKIYLVLNKPSGYISTCADDKGRETVLNIIKDNTNRLFPVGRLDFETEGLLILTNDGELAYRLTHPRHEIEKKYYGIIKGNMTAEKKEHLENGILLEGRLTSRSKITVLNANEKKSEITITIHEGRNRQVRRMMEAVGLQVEYLCRVSMGNISLKGLKPGEYRRLTENEINYIKSL